MRIGVELHFPVPLIVAEIIVNTNTESAGSHKVTMACKEDVAVMCWSFKNSWKCRIENEK